MTARAGIRACGAGMGAFWADLDGDGQPRPVPDEPSGPTPSGGIAGTAPSRRGRTPGSRIPLLGRRGVSRRRRRRRLRRRRRQLPRLDARVGGRPAAARAARPGGLRRPSRRTSSETKGPALPRRHARGGPRARSAGETKTLGVAVVDYDGDGARPLTSPTTASRNRLFRNRGDGRLRGDDGRGRRRGSRGPRARRDGHRRRGSRSGRAARASS